MNTNVIIILIFIVIVVWEFYWPKVKDVEFETRWPANYMLSFLTLAILIITSYWFELSESDVEVVPMTSSSGFIYIFKAIFVFVAFDLLLYWLHRLAHFYKVLWRFHCVHHSDPYFDLSTNFRHHPLELAWVSLVLSQLVVFFEVDAVMLGVYSLCATLIQMWHHSNTKLPKRLERILSLVIVTPSIHVVHHSTDYTESNTNFGAVFSLWDKAFHTFQAPKDSKNDFEVGIKGFSDGAQQSLVSLLIQPFQERPK